MRKKVLILGGSGVMGEFLLRELCAKSFECFSTSRKMQKGSENLTWLQGNARDTRFLTQLLSMFRWDAIVDFMRYSSTELSARLPMFLQSTDQYFLLSSARVYAQSNSPLKEDSPRLFDVCEDLVYLNTDEYALAKAREENMLFQSGLSNWTIIRPYITFSRQRLQLTGLEKETWLRRAILGKKIVLSKELLEKETTLTDASDVAKGIAALVGEESAMGKVFHITSPCTVKWSDILMIYKKVLEQNGIILQVVIKEDVPLSLCGGYYQIIYDRMYNRRFDNREISKYVDVNTFHNIEDALGEYLTNFLKEPSFQSINWRLEGLMDKLTGEFTNPFTIDSYRGAKTYITNRIF